MTKVERKRAPGVPKQDMVRKSGKDDVHEQREPGQPYEGILHVAPSRRRDERKKRPAHAKR
ncbi:MAG TPA: hypothetical protein VGH28_30145 [Polyangiaceae bacterium]|jgi:hypothetical protein